MSLSMYEASIPVFSRVLTNLSAILGKAAAHAESQGIDPAVLINARLAPDMFPLSRQVQIATDAVKGAAARLAQVDTPSFADTESSFADLQERVAKTQAFIQCISADQVNGSESLPISIKTPNRELNFSGQTFLLSFALPNLYFHVTTTYAILRHNGVALGKMDYLGAA
ncbi:DUF1993 domain-containing protein [Aquipseudomonas ullengensis]|uniref:DUF1993 domain-containing protein n=1 Tax=Aquipseudomonas ullengensis TaxID=2759166 RepID=A0A7W4LN56_9GAMM|nr:DUF1993 domain-containing protein [Pseudomonas ullengensis]MBB2496208.1 DUF1993 domain-containing protein [Pseudomonas ullengensis]